MIRFKENLENLYRRYDYWIIPALKFLTAITVFMTINSRLGYSPLMKNPVVIAASSVLCTFLPWSAVTAFSAVAVLANLHEASMELMVMALFVFLLIVLLQTAFRAGHAIMIALIPISFLLHIPYLIPVIAGLTCTPVTVIPVALGTVAFYFLQYISAHISEAASGSDITDMLNSYAGLFSGFLNDRSVLIAAAALAFGMLITFALRSLSVRYEWLLAAAAGLLSMFLAEYGGAAVLKLDFAFGTSLGYLLLSAAFASVFILFRHGADYRGTEHLQFEDDDYYYTVKAVPKLKSEKTNQNSTVK